MPQMLFAPEIVKDRDSIPGSEVWAIRYAGRAMATGIYDLQDAIRLAAGLSLSETLAHIINEIETTPTALDKALLGYIRIYCERELSHLNKRLEESKAH